MTRIVRPTLALALLLLAAPAVSHAQERASFKDSVGTVLLRTMYVATPLVHAADGFSTMRVLDLGGREMNPLIAAHVNNRQVFAATKVGLVAGQIFLAHHMSKDHKFKAILAMTAVNGAYALVAAHNIRVARGIEASRSGLR